MVDEVVDVHDLLLRALKSNLTLLNRWTHYEVVATKTIRPGRRFHHLTVVKQLAGNKYQFQCACGRSVECAWKTYTSCGGCGLPQRKHKRAYGETVRIRAEDPGYWIGLGYAELKSSAHRLNLPFDLALNDFAAISAQPCFYCGAPPSATKARAGLSIEIAIHRLEILRQAEGYTRGNCVAACRKCHQARSGMPLSDFAAWTRRISLRVSRFLAARPDL